MPIATAPSADRWLFSNVFFGEWLLLVVGEAIGVIALLAFWCGSRHVPRESRYVCRDHHPQVSHTKETQTYTLSLPATLHNRLSARIPLDRLNVVTHAQSETGQREHPEDDAERFGEAELEGRRLVFEVEADDDGDGDDGHVDGEAEVREEGCEGERLVTWEGDEEGIGEAA